MADKFKGILNHTPDSKLQYESLRISDGNREVLVFSFFVIVITFINVYHCHYYCYYCYSRYFLEYLASHTLSHESSRVKGT